MISLSAPRSAPAISLRDRGAYVSGHVLHQAVIPWTEFAADGKGGAQKVGKDGKPRNQLRLTLLVVAGDASVSDRDAPSRARQVAKGEEVSVYLHGHRWGAWIEATRKGASIGDIATIRYDREEPGQVRGTTKRVWTVAIDRGVPSETRATCEARYHEIESTKKAAPTTAAAPSAEDTGGDDEIPF